MQETKLCEIVLVWEKNFVFVRKCDELVFTKRDKLRHSLFFSAPLCPHARSVVFRWNWAGIRAKWGAGRLLNHPFFRTYVIVLTPNRCFSYFSNAGKYVQPAKSLRFFFHFSLPHFEAFATLLLGPGKSNYRIWEAKICLR